MVIICFPLFFSRCIIPFNAVLSLSVPPLVKIISFLSQLIKFATFFLASSTPTLAILPSLYNDDGFPYCSTKYGNILSNTSFFTLVVAAWSKYLIFIFFSPQKIFLSNFMLFLIDYFLNFINLINCFYISILITTI